MPTQKKSPGRPRLYESASEKLSAFRMRQEHAGYLRKEVLVTKETERRVKELSEQHSVKTIDVYSSLLEYGLQAYGQPESLASSALLDSPDLGSSQFMGFNAASSSGQPALCALPSGNTLSARAFAIGNSVPLTTASAPENPIVKFFQKRKETLNEK